MARISEVTAVTELMKCHLTRWPSRTIEWALQVLSEMGESSRMGHIGMRNQVSAAGSLTTSSTAQMAARADMHQIFDWLSDAGQDELEGRPPAFGHFLFLAYAKTS